MRFSATQSDGDLVCKPSAGQAARIGPFSPDAARTAAALAWIFELDSDVKGRFLRGEIASKRIPLADPSALPSLGDRVSADAYWRLRRPSGELIRPLLLPSPADEHLFPYQRDGVCWLTEQTVGILADDMGLGKTLQAIVAARQMISTGSARDALVVCPKTLLANWEAELEKWAPELSRVRVTPSGDKRAEAWETIVGRVHVLITNYEQLREPPDALSRRIPILITDEAHKVRNLEARVTRGIRRLQHDRFWALTGTPIERDPEDLATLLSTMEPARFSPADARLPAGVLRSRARPYVLRRLKSDVLDQLPDLLESLEVLELSQSQRRSYNAALAQGDSDQTSGALLRLINRLRTICDFDPDTGESIKADRIIEILEMVSAAGEKTVVFSYLLEPLRLLQERVSRFSTIGEAVVLDGSMTITEREAALSKFRTDLEVSALLASSRVGSEGLTLTEANHVIFFNEWWNPSANVQARDRVLRIGQQRGVRVYKFRCRNTIEDVLAKILEEKRETFEVIIDRLAEPAPGLDGELVSLVDEIQGKLAAGPEVE
jgi:SNF2 family DNA or RNA helicase